MAGNARRDPPRDGDSRPSEFKIRGAATRQQRSEPEPPRGPAQSGHDKLDLMDLVYEDRRRNEPHAYGRQSYDERSRHRTQYDDPPGYHHDRYNRDPREYRQREPYGERRAYDQRDYQDNRYDHNNSNNSNGRGRYQGRPERDYRDNRGRYDDRRSHYDNNYPRQDDLPYDEPDQSKRYRSRSPLQSEAPVRRDSTRRYQRSRSASPRRRSSADYSEIPPSREVKVDNLPAKMTEDQLKEQLVKDPYHVAGLEDLRVIRDKSTRECRGFGFLTFENIEHATKFINEYGPGIYVYDDLQNAGKMTAQFCKERKSQEKPLPSETWSCSVCNYNNFAGRDRCRDCLSLRPDAEPLTPYNPITKYISRNDGSTDAVEGPASAFLIFRELGGHITEELLFDAASKLFKDPNEDLKQEALKKGHKLVSTSLLMQAGARPNSIRRVSIARSKFTRESAHYGFVEFESPKDASDALARFRGLKDFTVGSKTVKADYIHTGVFIPTTQMSDNLSVPDNYSFPSSIDPQMRLCYWDKHKYVAAHNIPTFEPKPLEPKPNTKMEDVKTVKKRKPTANPSEPEPDALPIFKSWQKSHAEIHGGANKPAQAANNTKPKPGSDKAITNTDNGAQDTVAGDTKAGKPKDDDDDAKSEKSHASGWSHDSRYGDMPSELPDPTFVDETEKACLLCWEEFDTKEDRRKHEKEDEHHKANWLDDTKRWIAFNELNARGLYDVDRMYKPIMDEWPDEFEFSSDEGEWGEFEAVEEREAKKAAEKAAEKEAKAKEVQEKIEEQEEAEQTEEPPAKRRAFKGFSLPRDRAAERRAEEAAERRAEQVRRQNAPFSMDDDDDEEATPGIGNSMLRGMGWNQGSGLGFNQQGMTGPIQTRAYEKGVGLGAKGGDKGDALEEATRNTTKTTNDFLEKTRESARKRFFNM